MSDDTAAPGADEPDAPGTEDEPIPPGMEESEQADASVEAAAVSAPQEAPTGGEAGAAPAAAASADATYPYYAQQQTATSYPGYGEQYAGYDQYYGYWPGYGDASGTPTRSSRAALMLAYHLLIESCIQNATQSWTSQRYGWAFAFLLANS